MNVVLFLILFGILALYGAGAYFLGLRHARQETVIVNNHYAAPDLEQWHWPELPEPTQLLGDTNNK